MTDPEPPIERSDFENQLFGELPPGLTSIPEFSSLDEVESEKAGQVTAASRDRLIEDLPTTKDTAWDPERHAATVQAQLAFRLIWVLVGVIVVGAGLLATSKWTGIKAQNVSDFFGIAFAAVVTLTTAATSFWFGSQKHRSHPGND